MPLDAYKNFALSTLTAGINSAATSLTVQSGHGARFPAVPFNATIYNSTDYTDAATAFHAGQAEIIRVTAKSGDSFSTILRGQEGTTALNLNTGGKTYTIFAGLTARMPDELSSSGAPQFASLALGGAPTESLADAGVKNYIKRVLTSGASGVTLALHLEYISSAFTNANVGVGFLADIINNGNATGGAGHLVGLIGRAKDTASGGLGMYGVEGKMIRYGSSDSGAAVYGISQYIGTAFTGRTINVFEGFAEIVTAETGGSPVNEGVAVVYRGYAGVGGALKYVLLGDAGMQIATGGRITSSNTSNSVGTYIEHDGTDGKVGASGGHLRLVVPAGSYAILQDGAGLVPQTEGALLGMNSFRWDAWFRTVNIAQYLDVLKGSAPASPASGAVRIYVKSDDKPYIKNSAGVETLLGTPPLHLCVVSYPFDGNGSNSNTLTQSAFTKAVFTTVDVDESSAWDSVNNEYVVPENGKYYIATKLRVNDSSSANKSYGQGAGPTVGDNSSFSWYTTSAASPFARNSSLNERTMSLTAGQRIKMFYFVDGFSTTAQTEMTIFKIG